MATPPGFLLILLVSLEKSNFRFRQIYEIGSKMFLSFLKTLRRSGEKVAGWPWTTWIFLLGVGLFVWLWIFGNEGLYELEKLFGVKGRLVQTQAELTREKEELEAERKRLKDPRYLKHLIHKELGFVEKDEAMIQFVPKK
jgi:cell division protein FtsB